MIELMKNNQPPSCEDLVTSLVASDNGPIDNGQVASSQRFSSRHQTLDINKIVSS